MFDKLGIVTNIWAKCMASGEDFIALARQFGDHGFKHMEVREGDYLRRSQFGNFVGELEAAMGRYTDAQWKTICDAMWRGEEWTRIVHDSDKVLFQQARAFVTQVQDLTLSYAMSHPWLTKPQDVNADNRTITQAKKFAYLLCPNGARLRLVDPSTEGEIQPEVAIENVKRYRSLLPDYPMTFAVENARQSATLTLELARRGGALLTYDEANTYRNDGTTLNPPEAFWGDVKMEELTSVHFKQKTAEGVLSQVQAGFVDFAAIARRLAQGDYKGDQLLENTPTMNALDDALRSRDYLSRLL